MNWISSRSCLWNGLVRYRRYHVCLFCCFFLLVFFHYGRFSVYCQFTDCLWYTLFFLLRYHYYYNLLLMLAAASLWGSCAQNQAYFTRAVNKANAMGAKVGIYTSASQWAPIACGWTGLSGYPLWYAHYDNKYVDSILQSLLCFIPSPLWVCVHQP